MEMFQVPKKKTINEIQKFAKTLGGQCLSSEYVNARTNLKWKCNFGHTWQATYSNVNAGSWCRKCHLLTIKNNIIRAQILAKKEGGRCLSENYVNAFEKLNWQCENLHIWKASFNTVQQGHWCFTCRQKEKSTKRKHNIKYVKNFIEERGGSLVSKNYINALADIKIKCDKGHYWTTPFNRIQQGAWCRICGYRSAAKTLATSKTLTHWRTNEEIICTASYEIKVVETWNRNKIDFQWQIPFIMSDGKLYIIDAYLPKENLYIEIKGYKRKKGMEKWKWFHENYPNSELWDKNKLEELKIL